MSLDVSLKNEGKYRRPLCSYCKEEITQGQPVQFYQMSDDALRPLHTGCVTEQNESSNRPSIDSLLETADSYSRNIGIEEERLGYLEDCLGKTAVMMTSVYPSALKNYFFGTGRSTDTKATTLGIFDLLQTTTGILTALSLNAGFNDGEGYGWAAAYVLISGVKAVVYNRILKNAVKKTKKMIANQNEMLTQLHEQIKGTPPQETSPEKIIKTNDRKSLAE